MTKVKIRAGFETNSSSAHSLVLPADGETTLSKTSQLGFIDEANELHISGNTCFGWEWEIWDYPGDKVNYLIIDSGHDEGLINRLKRVIMDNTGTFNVVFDSIVEAKEQGSYNTYVDHQSIGTSAPVRKFNDEQLWNFIMNPSAMIRGGNDNSDGPWRPDDTFDIE
jgi:hypothetical protein